MKPKQVVSAIVHHQGKLYFQKRSVDRPFLPGIWDMLGGHVDPGETLEAALAREIREESGWELQEIITLLQVRTWQLVSDTENPERIEYSFLVDVSGDMASPKIELGKASEGRWFAKDESLQLTENHDPKISLSYRTSKIGWKVLSQKLPQTFAGTVIHGEKAGRTIGFPTANLSHVPSKETLSEGIYLAACIIQGKNYFGLAYFGPRYVFGETTNCFEVFLYDFNQEMYGEHIDITLTHYLRDPQDVSSLEELKNLIIQDKWQGQQFLEYYNYQII